MRSLILVAIALLSAFGCTVTPIPEPNRGLTINVRDIKVDPHDATRQWVASLSEGWRTALVAAEAAQEAFHYISDTPIKELQSESGSLRAGTLVTEARDLYRKLESYSLNRLPRITYEYKSIYEVESNREIRRESERFVEEVDLSEFGFRIVVDFALKSDLPRSGRETGFLRLRTIRGRDLALIDIREDVGRKASTDAFHFSQPFKQISVGDRVERIEDLIAKIRRP